MTTDGTPKVSDFGLAKRLEADPQTHSGAVFGTPGYMAPEQAAVLPRAIDVYALGTILYELLAGRLPFAGKTPMEALFRVIHEEPAPLHRVSG